MNRSSDRCLCERCGSLIPTIEERKHLEDGYESDGGACCYVQRKREEKARQESDARDAHIDTLQRLSVEALKGLNDGAAMMFEAFIAADETSDPTASPPDWFMERWGGEDPVPTTMALGAGCSLGISLAVSSALTGVPSPRTPSDILTRIQSPRTPDGILTPAKRPRTCSTTSGVPGPKTPPELQLNSVDSTSKYLDCVPQTPPLDELNSPDGPPPPTPTSPASYRSIIEIPSDSESILDENENMQETNDIDAIHAQENHDSIATIAVNDNDIASVDYGANDDDEVLANVSTASGSSDLEPPL